VQLETCSAKRRSKTKAQVNQVTAALLILEADHAEYFQCWTSFCTPKVFLLTNSRSH
jgi:hypothetical protein